MVAATEKDITIKGKPPRSIWPRWWWITPPPRPLIRRMRRMTPDCAPQTSCRTKRPGRHGHRNYRCETVPTALVGVQVDSEQFGSQQVSRNIFAGVFCASNLSNPQTRQYSGIWDGTFKPAYSNNPARSWIC
ncbi:hypothetical protein KCP78_23790 [Salmonella enterica subsp. enterica]|nr:hypothetical protein KCP78_23790 [Salmonella enterica subsp. enterica]